MRYHRFLSIGLIATVLGVGALSGALTFAKPSHKQSIAKIKHQKTAPKTELTWYGHAAFKIKTPEGHVLFIDPWLTNPSNPKGASELDHLKQADLILVSHGHFDHVGNAVEIAQKTHARLVATYDLGNALAASTGYPKAQMGFDTLGHFGGTLSFFNGEVRIALVPAVHGSNITVKDSDKPAYGGQAGGFVVLIKNGPTFYHTGDTDLFGDMALVKQFGHIDFMLACIGDHFTMGPERAAMAVQLINPSHVIPMHYGTFPILTGTVPAFRQALQAKGLNNRLMPLQIDHPIDL